MHTGTIGVNDYAMDFRAPFKAGEDHSADVWNQACYKIEIDMVEGKNDTNQDEEGAARKIDFYAVLHANADSSGSMLVLHQRPGRPGSGRRLARRTRGARAVSARRTTASTRPGRRRCRP